MSSSQKKENNGIRGETPSIHLPDFYYVKTCVPDYMHGICFDVIKQFLKLFFTGNKVKGYSLLDPKSNL